MATACIFAGDIGGTKSNLAIYAVSPSGALTLVRESTLVSHAFAGLDVMLARFLADGREPVRAAAFGVPGPVVGGRARITNLPWQADEPTIARVAGCPHVRLMNDLETTAYGALFVGADELLALNAGVDQPGNRAVIAAGTGLGEGLLFWDGRRYHPSATEGGHADFGPSDDRDIGLLSFVRREHGRVSWERVVSGPGLHNIFRYLAAGLRRPGASSVRMRMRTEDPSAVIGEAGLDGTCATCAEAVEMFVRLYGAQAGNLALTAMAVGGVYVGGGIVAKLLPKFVDGLFLDAFIAKDPHRALMQRMPVSVLLNPKTSQLGAAHAALDLL
jgi:glucokinase